MSQHLFQTTKDDVQIEVSIGYDRPLDGIFMTITRGGEVLYSSLEEMDPFDKAISYYRGKLAEFGISVPEEMLCEVELDYQVKDGERLVVYTADGRPDAV